MKKIQMSGMRLLCLLIIGFWVYQPMSQAQTADSNLVTLSGLLLTGDSLKAVPYANVSVLHASRGTSTDFKGFFSLVAERGDTILFTSLGFKHALYAIPEDLPEKRYSIVQLMSRDTFTIEGTVIYPWPSAEEFKEAFLTLQLPDDDLDRARKNLDAERLRELGIAMAPNASQMQDRTSRTELRNAVYYGQTPPQNIFNPAAWVEFFQAWKRGDFKRK